MRPLELNPAVIAKVHLKIDVQRVIIDDNLDARMLLVLETSYGKRKSKTTSYVSDVLIRKHET